MGRELPTYRGTERRVLFIMEDDHDEDKGESEDDEDENEVR